MRRRHFAVFTLLILISTLLTGGVGAAGGAAGQATRAAAPTVLTGRLGAADYRIEVPDQWNGTLLLYSHGFVAPGRPNPARSVSDAVTGDYLLSQGYALAGSSYSETGYAIEQAFREQTQLLDFFATQVGEPKRTIAWGDSNGGIITAGLIQTYPDRFDAALPMCGVLAGSVGARNITLDIAFVFKTLLAPDSPLQLVEITDTEANLQLAQQLLQAAQQTPEGRARLALAAAVGNIPGWFDPASPEPAPDDYAAQQQNQFLWFQRVNFPFYFSYRADQERRAGGNASWNTGVDYDAQLALSGQQDLVEALYDQAGLSLETDLATLAAAPRVAPDPSAVEYVRRYVTLSGHIGVPVLTIHTVGDGLVQVQQERAYADVVGAAGNGALLRQAYINRAGHCTFTPAERIAALQALVQRLDTGAWGDTSPRALNAAAAALGPELNTRAAGEARVASPPAYFQYQPSVFLRPFSYHSTVPSAATPGLPKAGGGGTRAGEDAPLRLLAGLSLAVFPVVVAGVRRRRAA